MRTCAGLVKLLELCLSYRLGRDVVEESVVLIDSSASSLWDSGQNDIRRN